MTNKAQEKRNVMQYFLQDINIGNNLKTLRKRFGYSQSELVAKLQLMGSNMSRSTYSKIETGTRNIRISDFIALKQITTIYKRLLSFWQ